MPLYMGLAMVRYRVMLIIVILNLLDFLLYSFIWFLRRSLQRRSLTTTVCVTFFHINFLRDFLKYKILTYNDVNYQTFTTLLIANIKPDKFLKSFLFLKLTMLLICVSIKIDSVIHSIIS